jgi:DNA-nicking Smr family endonuclease
VLDLHGHSLSNANKTVEKFINESFDNNIYKLKIITGKGLHSQNEKDPYVSKEFGILKNSIPEFINGNKSLMRKIYKIESAEIEDGGFGALNIYLKKNKLYE